MHLEKLIGIALPNADPALVAAAAKELRQGGAADEKALKELTEKVEDLSAELDTYRKEIGRLNAIIVNQRMGYENATPLALGVLAERARQRQSEGYDDSHDDEHDQFELSKAGFAYLQDAFMRAAGGEGFEQPPASWPWDADDWRRKTILREVEIGCALIVAEGERLARAGLMEA